MADKAKTLLAKMRFLEWLSTRTDLTVEDYRLAIVLTSLWSAPKGYAYPSLDQLADNLGRDKSATRRSILRLEELDVFTVRRGRGRGHANEYRPRFDLVPEGSIYKMEKGDAIESTFNEGGEPEEKGTSETEKGTSANVKGDLAMSPHPSKTPSEEVSNRSSAEAPFGRCIQGAMEGSGDGAKLATIERTLKENPTGLNLTETYNLLDTICTCHDTHDGNGIGGWAYRLLQEVQGMMDEGGEG